MTTVLSIDASLRVPTCAVSRAGSIVLRASGGAPVEDLAAVLADVLREASTRLSDVDEIVVGVGPGSYMGVRAAVTTANALSLATGKAVTGVVSVDAVAGLAGLRGHFRVAVPAGRNRFFVAEYAHTERALVRVAEPAVTEAAAVADVQVLARAPDLAEPVVPDAEVVLDAATNLSTVSRHPHLALRGEPLVAPVLPPPVIGARP